MNLQQKKTPISSVPLPHTLRPHNTRSQPHWDFNWTPSPPLSSPPPSPRPLSSSLLRLQRAANFSSTHHLASVCFGVDTDKQQKTWLSFVERFCCCFFRSACCTWAVSKKKKSRSKRARFIFGFAFFARFLSKNKVSWRSAEFEWELDACLFLDAATIFGAFVSFARDVDVFLCRVLLRSSLSYSVNKLLASVLNFHPHFNIVIYEPPGVDFYTFYMFYFF